MKILFLKTKKLACRRTNLTMGIHISFQLLNIINLILLSWSLLQIQCASLSSTESSSDNATILVSFAADLDNETINNGADRNDSKIHGDLENEKDINDVRNNSELHSSLVNGKDNNEDIRNDSKQQSTKVIDALENQLKEEENRLKFHNEMMKIPKSLPINDPSNFMVSYVCNSVAKICWLDRNQGNMFTFFTPNPLLPYRLIPTEMKAKNTAVDGPAGKQKIPSKLSAVRRTFKEIANQMLKNRVDVSKPEQRSASTENKRQKRQLESSDDLDNTTEKAEDQALNQAENLNASPDSDIRKISAAETNTNQASELSTKKQSTEQTTSQNAKSEANSQHTKKEAGIHEINTNSILTNSDSKSQYQPQRKAIVAGYNPYIAYHSFQTRSPYLRQPFGRPVSFGMYFDPSLTNKQRSPGQAETSSGMYYDPDSSFSSYNYPQYGYGYGYH